MREKAKTGDPYLRRPEQYDGQPSVNVEAWPSTVGVNERRSDRLAILAEWIDFFSEQTPIRRLRLACRVNDRLLAALAPQTQLESLAIDWGSYEALDVVGGLRRLRSLSLGASAIRDLSPLAHLDALRELELVNTRALTDYSPLGALAGLERLSVHRGITGSRSDADSLEFVRSFTALDVFEWDPRVASADYSPLLQLTEASRVVVTPHKGMSPSMIDLEWALPGMRAANAEHAARRIPVSSSDGDLAIMTTDVTGRTVFVPPLPGEEVEPPSWLRTPPLSGPVSGVTIRTFSSTARTRIERFWLQLESPEASSSAPPRSERTLSVFPFSGDAAGPILVWDSGVPSMSHRELEEFFLGNTDADVPTAPVVADTRGLEPLSDEDFWAVIETLDGKANQMASYKVVRALTSRGEDFTLRWAHTLSEHALRLMPSIAVLSERGIISFDHEWVALSAVIAAGRGVYENVLTDPDSFDPRLVKNASVAVIVAAESAMRDLRPDIETVLTNLSVFLHPKPDSPIDDGGAEELTPPHPSLCARAIVRDQGRLRERLVLFDGGGRFDEETTRRAVIALEGFGGEVVAGPEIAEGYVPRLVRAGSVFTIRRRSAMPIDEYLAKYGPRGV
jgi:hypothetical protein